MIMPSDKDYKETKQIMLGKASMKTEFRPLADWIDETFGVKTINIIYDTIDKGTRPRLEICFEFEEERTKFLGKNNTGFDSDKQNAIAFRFKQLLEDQGSIEKKSLFNFIKKPFTQQYKTDNIWVIYGAFEPVARIEANERISQNEVARLKMELDNKDLWEISRCFSGTTFFLYTDEQVRRFENSETRKVWADKYFDILEPYNDFGYFKRDKFNIYLDSKENFDNNYQSNWYYYYK